MDIISFVENFRALFEETNPEEIELSTNFKKLEEWSSLQALSTIAMVDEEYGITIKGDDIRNSNTVEDLFNAVKARTE